MCHHNPTFSVAKGPREASSKPEYCLERCGLAIPLNNHVNNFSLAFGWRRRNLPRLSFANILWTQSSPARHPRVLDKLRAEIEN